MSNKNAKKSSLTLGVLSGGAHNYNERIWNGINEVTKEHDISLISYLGLPVKGVVAPKDIQATAIYTLANKARIDGLLMISGSVFNSISESETSAYIRLYGTLPMISIGETIPKIPSIIINNHNGLYDLIVHLITDHNRRRIAFVGGPKISQEAQLRYNAYTAALTHYNLSIDANLIIEDRFLFQSGLDAVNIFLDQRQVKFDAIVAACDDIAFGIIEGLHLRGIQVPRDVSVIGFDNLPISAHTIPPLTTVHQPMEKLGRLAAISMLSLLNGEVLPLVTQVPTIPVFRQSCNCPSSLIEQAWVEQPVLISTNPQEKPFYEEIPRETIYQAMALCISQDTQGTSTIVEHLLDTFLNAINQKTPIDFLKAWSQVMRQALLARQDLFCWQEVLSVMRRHLLPFFVKQSDSHLANNYWYQAQVLLTEKIWQAHVKQKAEADLDTSKLLAINHIILMALSMEELLALLADQLPQIGIKSGAISLYENVSPNEPIEIVPDWSRMIFAFDENGRFPIPETGYRFPSTQLAPPNVLRTNKQQSLFTIPLYIKETPLGFGLFEVGYPTPHILNLLRDQISSAIHSAMLIQQIQQSKVGLEKQVQERTQELEMRNAELERFTYTISHELKSPLITIQGFLGFLEKDAATNNIERLRNDINHISEATNHMHSLLEELLELSRIGKLVNKMELISLSKITQDAILLVSKQINASNVQITLPTNLPMVYCDPRRLVEVMQNLLDNAVKFMGDQEEPMIEISAENSNDAILCSVRDNGKGIQAKYFEKIFGLFDRLDQSIDGTGIGLALVKRIIEMHNGKIWVESEGSYKGTTFYFTLPKPADD